MTCTAKRVFCGVLLFCYALGSQAQDQTTQYPLFLRNSYVGLHIGYIDYSFSGAQLEPGFNVQGVRTPHLSVRALLLGHEFNKYLSAQLSYMRPVQWVEYDNVNGDQSSHSIWMNVAGLTLKSTLPLTRSLSVYGEGGLGIVTRKGFQIGASAVVKNADYGAFLLGGGIDERLNHNWDLVAGAVLSPAHGGAKQPRTSFFSGGFNYTMRRLSADEVQANSESGFLFPTNLVQVGVITNSLGYGVNNFVSKGAVPVFWAADVEVAQGTTINYQRTAFHNRRSFSFSWGGGISAWKSQAANERFFTASLYPAFRFTPIRTKPVDTYFVYSLAGPTFISRHVIDGANTGKQFTFQDFMGIGFFLGSGKHVNAELRIAHFSNGNIFPSNPGVTVPLGFNAGYAF